MGLRTVHRHCRDNDDQSREGSARLAVANQENRRCAVLGSIVVVRDFDPALQRKTCIVRKLGIVAHEATPGGSLVGRQQATIKRGRVSAKLRGFDYLNVPRRQRTTSVSYGPDTSAPLLNLRSTNGDILLVSSGHALASREQREPSRPPD